jgi:uncharacterized protein YndB with AHSA1/START domain
MSEPIIVERLIDAPPEVVYSYLTVSEKWVRWQGSEVVIVAEPGGRFVLTMSNGSSATGEFVELDPVRRVVVTWGWVGHPDVPPGSTIVEIDLAAEGTGTRLTLTHRGLPPGEIAIHRSGWDHYSDRLVVAAEGGDPGPDIQPGRAAG